MLVDKYKGMTLSEMKEAKKEKKRRQSKAYREAHSKVVYIHRKATNGEIFYVGIGTPKRPYEKANRSAPWINTYNKHGRDVQVIRTGLSWEDACDIEMDLIELIGRRDKGLGTLVNLTDGGEGAIGVVFTEERKANMSRAVVDTSTGIVYKGMGVACKELGFKVSTITDQLRGYSRVQLYNTLRYLDDIDCIYCEVLAEPERPFNEIKHGYVIDIATNKIYNSMKIACKDMEISYSAVRNQLSGGRKRKDWNTLYKLSELTISPEGYETKPDPVKSSKKSQKGIKKPRKPSMVNHYMQKYLERQRLKEELVEKPDGGKWVYSERYIKIQEEKLIAYRRKSA